MRTRRKRKDDSDDDESSTSSDKDDDEVAEEKIVLDVSGTESDEDRTDEEVDGEKLGRGARGKAKVSDIWIHLPLPRYSLSESPCRHGW